MAANTLAYLPLRAWFSCCSDVTNIWPIYKQSTSFGMQLCRVPLTACLHEEMALLHSFKKFTVREIFKMLRRTKFIRAEGGAHFAGAASLSQTEHCSAPATHLHFVPRTYRKSSATYAIFPLRSRVTCANIFPLGL